MKQRIDVGCRSTLSDRTSGKANHGTNPCPRPCLTKAEDQLYIIETSHTALEQWVWPVYELQMSTHHLMPTTLTLIAAVSASKKIMQQLGASFESVECACKRWLHDVCVSDIEKNSDRNYCVYSVLLYTMQLFLIFLNNCDLNNSYTKTR